MRYSLLTILFLLGIVVSLHSQTIPDQVRLSYNAYLKPIDLVLSDLSKRSGVAINFSKNVTSRRKITINAKNETLGTILTVILPKARLRYEIVGDQIVIMRSKDRRPLKDPVISGYLTDKRTGEALIGANIYTTDYKKGTITNDYGFYSLKLVSGTYRVQFSYVGYKIERKQYYINKDTTINIELDPEVLLNDVIIKDSRTLPIEETSASEETLIADEIQSIVSLGGEPDVMRLTGFLPGVNSGPDGLGGLNVRGGSSDQNLVLLDGIPVYNASHALGVYSIFNPNIVKSAKVIKGAFPSRYGGRLSSVIDIRTKEGSTKKYNGEVGLSTVAVKGYAEGPLLSDKNSFVVSARRTFVDPWIKEVTKYLNNQNGKEGFANYFFYDLNAKMSFSLGNSSKIHLGAYMGSDDFSNEISSFSVQDEVEIDERNSVLWDWGNKIYYARLNNQIGSKFFSNFSLYWSDYQFNSFDYDRAAREDSEVISFDFRGDLFRSAIQDIGLKWDGDFIINPSNWIKLGGGIIQHKFRPSLIQAFPQDFMGRDTDPTREEVSSLVNTPTIDGREFFGYIEDEIDLGSGVLVNAGVHSALIQTESKDYFSLQPRIALVTQSDNLIFKLGASKMVQFLHLLSSNGLGLPTDVWLPSTDILAPEESWIYSGELSVSLDNSMNFGIEGYYKTLDRVISYGEGGATSISEENDWESSIPIGTGSSYGLELFFNKRAGRTTWLSNYTYSLSNRLFDDLNLGRQFPFRYDRRHNIKLAFVHRITNYAQFGLNYNISSGNPFTEPTAVQPRRVGDDIIYSIIYEEKNNALLDNYQRLDISFSFFSKYKWGRQKVSIGVYNLLNTKNPFYSNLVINPNDPLTYQIQNFSVLPIFPSISYSLVF